RARRVLRSEPVLPSLQARHRRHAGAVPDARKNRLKVVSPAENRQIVPLTIPYEQGGSAWSPRWRGPTRKLPPWLPPTSNNVHRRRPAQRDATRHGGRHVQAISQQATDVTHEEFVMTDFRLLIDGKLVNGAGTLDVINPATGRVLTAAPRADRAQLDEAVAAAKAAFLNWSATPLRQRAALLVKLYSKRMKLAQLPTAGGIPNVQLKGSCTGGAHAPIHVHPRSPRRLALRALPPPSPAGATAGGSPLAQGPGAHPRGHRPPGRRRAPQRPALPRRLRRRRPGALT